MSVTLFNVTLTPSRAFRSASDTFSLQTYTMGMVKMSVRYVASWTCLTDV